MSFNNKEDEYSLRASSIKGEDTSFPNTLGDGSRINTLQQKIVKLARELMKKHYVLDTDDLLAQCLRYFRNDDRFRIFRDFNDLIYRKILVNGKAITRDTLLENSNRTLIYDLIKSEPGIHFSKIKNTLGKDSRTIQWHLKMLEKFDLIRIEKYGRNVVYFNFLLEKNYDLFHYFLHKKNAILIFSTILDNPGISFIKLLDKIGIPRTTLMGKLKILFENGFLNIDYQSNQLISIFIKDEFTVIFREYISRL